MWDPNKHDLETRRTQQIRQTRFFMNALYLSQFIVEWYSPKLNTPSAKVLVNRIKAKSGFSVGNFLGNQRVLSGFDEIFNLLLKFPLIFAEILEFWYNFSWKYGRVWLRLSYILLFKDNLSAKMVIISWHCYWLDGTSGGKLSCYARYFIIFQVLPLLLQATRRLLWRPATSRTSGPWPAPTTTSSCHPRQRRQAKPWPTLPTPAGKVNSKSVSGCTPLRQHH